MIADLKEAWKSKWLAVDWETNAKDPRWDPEFIAMGVALAFRNELGIMCSEYYPINHPFGGNESQEVINDIYALIENHPILIYHNAKFDREVNYRVGLNPRGTFYDTMLMAHWLDENLWSKELDWLGKRFVGRGKNMTLELDTVIKGLGWGNVPGQFMKSYSANDAEVTFDLFLKFLPKWQSEGYDGALWQREIEYMDLIRRMERIGVLIDQNFCEEQATIGDKEMARLTLAIGFNASSNKQLGQFLIEGMGLPIVATTKTGCKFKHEHDITCRPSFDKNAMVLYEEILEGRNDNTASDILAYRGWQKTVSSNYRAYLELVSNDGRLRPNFLLHGTRTGRLSCRKPNLQQIPKSSSKPWNGGLKRAFLATPGYKLVGFDYSNLELRLAAIYSGDKALLDSLNSGIKVFQAMADDLGWEYDPTKRFTYATLYGGGVTRIRNIFNISFEAAKAMRSEFFGRYPSLRTTSDYAASRAQARGYVSLWTERRRHFPKYGDEGAHKPFNSLLQGGAAEIVKSQQLAVAKELDWDSCRMLLQVHDEIAFESADPKWEKIIPEILSDVGYLHPKFNLVPFPVEAKAWGV